ncbi:MAG: AAA family ATPase [Promethearchaeota archaeon]|jgi:dephospho-CoA kinase
MKILAIVGLPGSGKTTAIEAIKDLGVVVTMGDIVRNEAKKRNIEPSGINLGKIAQQLRKSEGSGIIAKKCVDLIIEMKDETIFIDGIRSLFEVNIFRNIWKFPIIAIIVDEKKRLRRLFKRSRSDDPKDLAELKERDMREIKFGLDRVLKEADYKIKNNSTIDDLKKKTRAVVLKVIQNY